MGYDRKPSRMAQKQACAAIGQAKLMMIYQKLFAEYNQVASQILMTKHTILNNLNRLNAKNTFEELLRMGAIPIVNEMIPYLPMKLNSVIMTRIRSWFPLW